MTDEPKPLPRVERDSDDDHPVFFHVCDDRHTLSVDIGGKLPLGPDGWEWQADGSLTPSIHCLECNCHGMWTKGAWRPA